MLSRAKNTGTNESWISNREATCPGLAGLAETSCNGYVVLDMLRKRPIPCVHRTVIACFFHLGLLSIDVQLSPTDITAEWLFVCIVWWISAVFGRCVSRVHVLVRKALSAETEPSKASPIRRAQVDYALLVALLHFFISLYNCSSCVIYLLAEWRVNVWRCIGL